MPHSRTLPCSRALSTLHGAALSTHPPLDNAIGFALAVGATCAMSLLLCCPHIILQPYHPPVGATCTMSLLLCCPHRLRQQPPHPISATCALAILSPHGPSTTPAHPLAQPLMCCCCCAVPTWTFNPTHPSVQPVLCCCYYGPSTTPTHPSAQPVLCCCCYAGPTCTSTPPHLHLLLYFRLAVRLGSVAGTPVVSRMAHGC